MADFNWSGGTSGSFNVAGNWSTAKVPTYGTIGVPAGTTITSTTTNNIGGLSITTGDGSGTVTFSGGSLSFYDGLSPGSNQNVIFTGGATFSTSDPLGGSGTITLDGATVNGTGPQPTGTFAFKGTNNILNIKADQANNITITGLADTDTIKVSGGGSGTLHLSPYNGSSTQYQLTYTTSSGNTVTISDNVTFARGVTPMSETGSNGSLTFCFLAGTRLATPDGDIAVEDITAGTMLLTASGETKPVRWLGRSVVATKFADPMTKLPIRIKAGALGQNLPVRDLLVSPCHAMFIGNVLVEAGAMVNGASITRETDMPERFTYYHVELATHELLLAEGAPAESFVDYIDRMGFQNWAEHEAIAEPEPIEEMPYPRVRSHRQMPATIRRILSDRATPYEPAKAA
jgi:hypothetical protein